MKTFARAVSHITQNLVEKFEKASDVATKGLNQTQSDVDQVWRDFDNACKDAKKTSIDAAYAELKEHVTKQMQDGGMSKAGAEKLFENKWQAVMDLGEKIHRAAPKGEKAGTSLWLKVLGVIAAIPVMILGFKMGTAAPTRDEIRMHNNLQDEARINAQMQSFQTSEEQFAQIARMMGDLNVPSAPEPLPVAVAAAAPEPVEVEVITSSGTQEFTSTVGRVWQSVPQARHEIEQEALYLDHGYDHPDPNSCVATDCLSQHRNLAFHKEFTVDSPIGKAHFKY
jgi:hypothetical protein